MKLRKRHVLAILSASFLLFWGVRYSLEWRREYVSAGESLQAARHAMAAGDVETAIRYLDEGQERASQDREELSSLIFEELSILDGAPQLSLDDAVRLYQYRIALQKLNCETQSWEEVLSRRVRALGWPEREASAHFHMLHPGRELLEMSLARAETLRTFGAWKDARDMGQRLKESAAVPEWANVLRAFVNLKAHEEDALGVTDITVAPIMGWVRSAIRQRPDDAMLQRSLYVSLAIASEDDAKSERTLPRPDPLLEAIASSDEFMAEYPDSIPGQLNSIEARLRASELAAIHAERSAQDLLDTFAEACPASANWRDILRATDLQLRALPLLDPGSPAYAQGVANVKRLAGALLERSPGAPDALLALGRLYRQLGQDNLARASLAEAAAGAIRCPPSLRAFTWGLSVGLAEMELVDMDMASLENGEAASPEELDRISAAIERVAERLGPQAAQIAWARGRLALLRGQTRVAVSALESACSAAGKEYPSAFLLSGKALAEAGEWGSAEGRLQVLFAMRRTRPEQRLQGAQLLSEVLLRTLPPDAASSRITELAAPYPFDGRLQLARSEALLHTGLQFSTSDAARGARLASVQAALHPLILAGDQEAALLSAQAEALLGTGEESLRGLAAYCQQHPRDARGIQAWCQALRLRGLSDQEEAVVRQSVLPQASPAVARALEWALQRETRPRSFLYPLLRLAFVDDPAEQQLGLFWVSWGTGDAEGCRNALTAGLDAASEHLGLLGAKLAFLLDQGQSSAAREFLASLPSGTVPDWQRRVWEAKLMLAVRDHDGARHALDRLARDLPDCSEVVALQGSLLQASGDPALAMLRFEAALKINPLQPIALRALAAKSIRRKEPVQAFSYLRRLIRLDAPDSAQATEELLEQLTQSGTEKSSIRLREHALQQAPWDRSNRRELALLYAEARQGDRARGMLEALVAEDPGDVQSALDLARILRGQGRGPAALRALRQVAANASSAAADPACLDMADMLADLGGGDEARQFLSRLLDVPGPVAAGATLRLGSLLFAAGRWEEAGSAYANCPDADRRPDVLRRWTECLIRAGKREEARTKLGQLQRLVPDDPLASTLMGELAMLDGDLAQARSSCAKALDKDPGCAVAYFLRARIALREGDRPEVWDRAIRDLQKACIRDPKLTDARELLVRLLIERGQTAEADSALLMLSAARPTDDRLKLAWAELLLVTNRQSKLASMLERWHRERPDHPTWLRIRGMLAAQEHRLSEAASAFAQHARQTGDAGSLLGAVAAYVVDEQPEEAARLLGELPAEVTGQPAGVMASAYLAPAGDGASVRQRVARALRDARDPALAQELLEHARQLLAPDQLVGVLADLYAAGPSTIHGLALAECLEASGEAPKAADLLRKLADGAEGRERAELLARVAAAEFASGDLNKAESTLQDALKISPEDPALLNNAAHLALRSGQRDAEAAQLAQRAVAASADDRELQACALGTLGEAYFNLRLYPKSRQALVAALAIRDAADDRYLLGRALMAGGDTVKGVVQLRRAKALAEQDGNTELIRKIAALL